MSPRPPAQPRQLLGLQAPTDPENGALPGQGLGQTPTAAAGPGHSRDGAPGAAPAGVWQERGGRPGDARSP